MNLGWRANTEEDTTVRERVDRKHYRQRKFPQGTTLWKRAMDVDHMKMFFHMQHISSASTEKRLWPAWQILAISRQCCVLCAQRTNCTVLDNTYCISHAMITGLKFGISLWRSLYQCIWWWPTSRQQPSCSSRKAEPLFHVSSISFSLHPALCCSLKKKKTCFRRCQAINIVMRAVVSRPDILHAHQHKSNDYYPRAL